MDGDRSGRNWWLDDDGVPADAAAEATGRDRAGYRTVGNDRQQLSVGPGEPGDPSVIDLGERPAVDAEDPEGSGDRSASSSGTRRPVPRRYLALAGAGLVALGFVGGVAVERSTSVAPMPSSDSVNLNVPPYALPSPVVRCGGYVYGHVDQPPEGYSCPASGTIRMVTESVVVLEPTGGGSLTMSIDASTLVDGEASSITALHAGQYVSVRAVQLGGRLVAETITVD